MAAVTCAGCGRPPHTSEPSGADGVPWTWSREPGPGAADADGTVLCVTCTREHARGIEAKLDPEWW